MFQLFEEEDSTKRGLGESSRLGRDSRRTSWAQHSRATDDCNLQQHYNICANGWRPEGSNWGNMSSNQ